MSMLPVYQTCGVELERGIGNKVYDTKGQDYLDLYGGHAVISIGHSHPHYCKEVSNQLHKLGFYSNYVDFSIQSKLVHKLAEISGLLNYQLFLCNSGAEAIENAVKLASFATGRTQVVTFSGAFHGRTSLAISMSDAPSLQAPLNQRDDVIMHPFNDAECLDTAITEKVAAVVLEGVQGLSGIHRPHEKFIRQVQSQCKKVGAKFIVDEIQSGFGRTGKFFAYQNYEGIEPDFITMGKGMGNGFPVAGVYASPEIKAKVGMLGSTFGGNPLACQAALAVLDVLKNENLLENARSQGQYLLNQLQEMAGIESARGIGLMIAFETSYNLSFVRNKLLKDFHIFTGTANAGRTIRLLPPLTITKEELDYFIDSLKFCLNAYGSLS